MMTGRGFVRAQPLRARRRMAEARRRSSRPSSPAGRVGILGLGRIGKAIAERVSAMGMKVAYTGRKPQERSVRVHAGPRRRSPRASDFLVVACPGGAATRNIVNAEVLAALGKKGTLVNIARGSIVDEPALVDGARRTARSRAPASTCSPTSRNVPRAAARDGQRRAAAARRQRDARDAQGDGRPVQGEPRRVVRRQGRC